MLHIGRTLCLPMLLWLIGSSAAAQWVPSNGPYGGYIYSLAANNTKTFAGTNSGVYRSTNNGETWLAAGLTNFSVYALAIKGDSLLAGVNGGLFITSDDGVTWSEPDSATLCQTYIEAFAVKDTCLFAASEIDGVFRSTNKGRTWSPSGLRGRIIYSLAAIGKDLFAGTTGPGVGNCLVYRSTDNGNTWNPSNTGMTIYDPVESFAVCDTFLFAAVDGGVFRTSNHGTSWSTVNVGLTNKTVTSLVTKGTTLFAGTYNGVFRSTNNGVNWNEADTDLMNPFCLSLTANDSSVFAGTYGTGVFRSDNDGQRWMGVSCGLSAMPVLALYADQANLFAGTPSGGVYVSNPDSGSWTPANSGLTNMNVKVFSSTDSFIFVGTYGAGVSRSGNGGKSWTRVGPGTAPNTIFVYALFNDGKTLIAGTFGVGIFTSTNYGSSWKDFSAGLMNASTVYGFARIGTSLFAGTDNGVYRAGDNDPSWTAIALPRENVLALATWGATLVAGTDGAGIYLSTDNGVNWKATNTGLTNTHVYALLVSGPNIFAGTDDGVFHSFNGAVSWTPVNAGLSNTHVHALALSGDDLFIGTEGGPVGVWRRPLAQMTGVERKSSGSPWSFSLSQNYPNPFNPSTTINFSLSEAEVVSLKVYDVLGKEVAELIRERLRAGYYRVTWDAHHEPSGVYFVELRAGSFTRVKKMILTK